MIAVQGRRTTDVTRAHLDELAAGRPVTLDLGAGDGKFAYNYARRHPERFVVAIEPVRENLREASARAARKSERGGAANVLYVAASVEMLPDELAGVADEVLITLPWGSLMRGLILGEAPILDGIARLSRPGAPVRIVLNTRIFEEPLPVEARDLPEVTPEYVERTLAAMYAAHGLRVTAARFMDTDEVAQIGTTWAKRLSHRSPPRSVLIEAVRT